MRHALTSMRAALDGGERIQAKAALRITVSLIDKLARKRIIHANAAARHKSRLTKRLAKTSAAA